MMRSYDLNSHVYSVRTEMTGTKCIIISHVCSVYKRESEEFPVEETLLQVCSTDKDKSKSIIVDAISMEESESECVHKNINKEKDANIDADYEESTVTDYPVFKEPSYFNMFECGNIILNMIDAMCQRACMATPIDKYYTKMYKTLVDHNDRNDAPVSTEKIQQEMRKLITKEEADARNITSDAHNATADNFCQTPVTPNTQR